MSNSIPVMVISQSKSILQCETNASKPKATTTNEHCAESSTNLLPASVAQSTNRDPAMVPLPATPTELQLPLTVVAQQPSQKNHRGNGPDDAAADDERQHKENIRPSAEMNQDSPKAQLHAGTGTDAGTATSTATTLTPTSTSATNAGETAFKTTPSKAATTTTTVALVPAQEDALVKNKHHSSSGSEFADDASFRYDSVICWLNWSACLSFALRVHLWCVRVASLKSEK